MEERKQSGVVPYVVIDGEIQIIMIKKKGDDAWGFPKGGIEKGMTPIQSALKEAVEEAGLRGKPGKFLGITRYKKKGVPQSVQWYMMEAEMWTKSFPEMDKRKRKFFSIDKALDKVDDKWSSILSLALTRL